MPGLGPPGGQDNKLADAIAAMVKEQQDRELADAAKKAREEIIEIQSSAFDKGAAYTNLITLGGYAGAFGLWSYTRDHLTKNTTIAVALLLGISIVVFVLFEVYKMTLSTRIALKQRRLVVGKHPPAEFLKGLEALRREVNEDGLKWMMPIWAVALGATVLTGLSAVGLLFYNFFAILLGLPAWPA